MPRTILLYCAFLAPLFLGPSVSQANDDFELYRSPLGVYARVDIETAISAYTGSPSPTQTQLRVYLIKLYAQLLSDPAVRGLTIGERWDNIQPAETAYNWSYLDDAFAVANEFRKPVQLILTPGVDSPPWAIR